jgi:hypothetical protein
MPTLQLPTGITVATIALLAGSSATAASTARQGTEVRVLIDACGSMKFNSWNTIVAAAEKQKKILQAKIRANEEKMRQLLAENQRVFSMSQMKSEAATEGSRSQA